ncbi:MAG: redoxin domain-containing protein, partial [Planctomycetales bacterium]|nr:redoxin domain-containing protein [Planctomycetales bacterium]
FWATWCGPCVMSMPHLVEMQNRFAAQGVQIISVSREDLKTVEDFLPRAYKPRGGNAEEEAPATYGELTSAYCLTCDPDGSVDQDYMRAAGQNGIPCCFIVGKTSQIEWIGHPGRMDEPLDAVVNDRWDREAYLVEFQREQKRDILRMEVMQKLGSLVGDGENIDMEKVQEALDGFRAQSDGDEEMLAWMDDISYQIQLSPVIRQMTAGKFDEAEEALKKLEADAAPDRLAQLYGMRMQAYLSKGEFARAAAALESFMVHDAARADDVHSMAWTVVSFHEGRKTATPELLAAAEKAARQVLAAQPDDAGVLDTVAHLQAAQGDLAGAIATQEQAVAKATGDQPGLEEYLETLREQRDGAGEASEQ